jgi:flagellar FliL protein
MADPIDEPVAPAAGGSKVLVAGLAALLLGAALGVFVVAPRLGAGGAEPAAEAEAEPVKKVLFELQNVIVNPAGSQGQRFIVATVAFEVASEEVRNTLHESETQIRDGVTGVLERKTVEELLRPGARDAMRGAFAEVVAPYLKGAKVQVFIPQFLVQ